jgi:heptosyltransferase-1
MSETTPGRGVHAVDRMLSVLEAGELVEPSDAPVSFAGDRLPAEPWHDGPRPGENFALLHPCTAWNNKNYPVAGWAAVARAIKRQSGLATWVAWGPGEEGAARDLAAQAGEDGVRALERLASLPQLTALSRAARLVLGGDTGPIHLAHALGTPVVCVMGPTDPERNGPYRAPVSTLVHRLPCSFCYQRLEDTKACLLEIAPEQVAERALAALG